jgi:hypothetical protein
MTPVIYVINVKDHPEYPVDTLVGETPMSVAKVYMQGYSVPMDLADNLCIYDCYAANMYHLEHKDG